MQMILDYAAPDLALWQQGFDARAEARGAAGVQLLQIWLDADAPALAVCLFQISDRKRAADWLRQEAALHGAGAVRFLQPSAT